MCVSEGFHALQYIISRHSRYLNLYYKKAARVRFGFKISLRTPLKKSYTKYITIFLTQVVKKTRDS